MPRRFRAPVNSRYYRDLVRSGYAPRTTDPLRTKEAIYGAVQGKSVALQPGDIIPFGFVQQDHPSVIRQRLLRSPKFRLKDGSPDEMKIDWFIDKLKVEGKAWRG